MLQELHSTSTSYIQPLAFFVSWQGVLTLAFSGWPAVILLLKDRIQQSHPNLPPEASGSKWPKTSLGCLKDGVTLTEDQFNKLNALCQRLSLELLSSSDTNNNRKIKIALDTAALVIYECRSLEKLVFHHIAAFSGAHDDDLNDNGLHHPSTEEQRRVKGIVAEADEPEYYLAVARPGHRESHYRGPSIGSTLVHPLALSTFGAVATPVLEGNLGGSSDRGQQTNRDNQSNVTPHAGLKERGILELQDRLRLIDAIHIFRCAVDELFPGLYCWFDDNSLHVTLRAIIM